MRWVNTQNTMSPDRGKIYLDKRQLSLLIGLKERIVMPKIDAHITQPPPYALHLWLKTHLVPGTNRRLSYREVARRAGISHATLYAFCAAYEPNPEQRSAILRALRDMGFRVSPGDVFGVGSSSPRQRWRPSSA